MTTDTETTGPADEVRRSTELLGQMAEAAGMTNYLNHGAASHVSSEGCHGVTQEHLERFAELLLAAERERCQPNGLMFDALGEPRKRYVRVTLNGSHCVLRPSEGDRYVQDARADGDESEYTVSDVYLSEREFDDLGEFDGF